MSYRELRIMAVGGSLFDAHLIGDADTRNIFLGTVEVGEVADDGEWIGDDEVERVVRDAFGDRIPSDVIAVRVF